MKNGASASAMSVMATLFLTWIAANNYSSQSANPTLPTGRVSTPPLTADATRPRASIAPATSTYDESLTLRPLRDAVFGEGSERGKNSMQSLMAELGQADRVSLRSLLVTVPNPSGSLGYRFDETIESIERAARPYGYVLERWRLPWSEQPEHSKPEVPSDTKGQPRKSEDPQSKPASSSPQTIMGDPGLLVFRRTSSSRDHSPHLTDLLLVFLITETPTQGIDRLALTRALKLAEALGEPGQTDRQTTRQVNFVAPCFSGSMPSLRDGSGGLASEHQ